VSFRRITSGFDVADCLLLPQALDILKKKKPQKPTNYKKAPFNAWVSNPSPTSIKKKSQQHFHLSIQNWLCDQRSGGANDTSLFSFSIEKSDSHILQVWFFSLGSVCYKESVA